MNRIFAAAGLGLILAVTPVIAQQSGPSGTMSGESVGTDSQLGTRGMTGTQFNQLQDYIDLSKRLTREDRERGRTVEDLMREDREAASAITTTMPLGCQVDKAILAAHGPETVNGQTVQTKTYETICSNGMGYFLTSRDQGSATGLSCLAADATRAADVAAGRHPGPVCNLPELTDPKTLLTNVITRAGTPCTVHDYRWRGANAAAHLEFDEVVCTDNRGYILTIALPGSTAPVRVSTCHDSAMRGLSCRLSDNGSGIVTIENFRDALRQRGIACDASDRDIHVVGQENVQKRFVVEFKCSQHPQGLVAYIPMSESRSPFEALDCPAAARRNVHCTLTQPRP